MLNYAEGNGVEQRQAAPGQLVWPEREFCRRAVAMSNNHPRALPACRQGAEFLRGMSCV
jgi:hypothetical protein